MMYKRSKGNFIQKGFNTMIEVIRDNTKEKFYTLCENCLSELSTRMKFERMLNDMR